MTSVLVPLADGCEEMEAVIVIDTLRRAGWTVVAAGIRPGPVTASRGVKIIPDAQWEEVRPEEFDLLVIPGGARGTENLQKDPRVLEAVRLFAAQGKPVAAVCAGPLVLQAAGILKGKRVTCHPAVESKLTVTPRLNDRVVTDGALITSQGPGTSFEFALAIIRSLEGFEKAESIARAMVLSGFPD